MFILLWDLVISPTGTGIRPGWPAQRKGVDGAEPGHRADSAEDKKLRQYTKEFPGFSQESSPSLEIISMEHHGS